MFVIPCKYNATSNYIIDLVTQIREYHSDEKIMVVDSDSSDKSYFSQLESLNVIVEDVANTNWMIGAYWHGYKKFPDEDFYFFFHDSMKVKANLDYLKEKNLFLLADFNREAARSFNAWNDKILQETKIDKRFIKSNGRGCYGPIFGCKNWVMKSLLEKGVDKLLPSNKRETGFCEGAYGLFFESLGFNLSDCVLYGDILKLESPGGKSGPYPHDTSWEYPIEKFYASHQDQRRK